jgi:hypothetical protein
MSKPLTPARFVALYNLAMNPGPIGHLNKRTRKTLMDADLIEWCDTTDVAQIYRATPAGVDAARTHLAYLAKRESEGRVYRSDDEQQYQDRAEYRLAELEKAVAETRPETSADRIAELNTTADLCPNHQVPDSECEGDHCADCAELRDDSWPLGSDVCGRCWALAEADDEESPVEGHVIAHQTATRGVSAEEDTRADAVGQEDTPAPLPRRVPATRVQDVIDRHHGVDPDQARTIANALGTAGFNALQSADTDGYLTAGHPASLASMASKGLMEQAQYPAAGGGPRTYRITPLGRVVARLKAAALADPAPGKKPRVHRIPVKHADTPTGRTYTAACRDCDHTVGPYPIRAIAEERAGMHRTQTRPA